MLMMVICKGISWAVKKHARNALKDSAAQTLYKRQDIQGHQYYAHGYFLVKEGLENALGLSYSLGGCPRIVFAARASENFVDKAERAKSPEA